MTKWLNNSTFTLVAYFIQNVKVYKQSFTAKKNCCWGFKFCPWIKGTSLLIELFLKPSAYKTMLWCSYWTFESIYKAVNWKINYCHKESQKWLLTLDDLFVEADSWFEGIVHLEMKIFVINSPSCHSKPVWRYSAEHKRFWRTLVTNKQQLYFHCMNTHNVNTKRHFAKYLLLCSME